jgi:hypothetical protein
MRDHRQLTARTGVRLLGDPSARRVLATECEVTS